MMTETRECGICMDKAASLRCQRCSYVFCDECCEKLATYKHIRRCIHCNQQHPWIKSLDPESMLSENITKLIASPDIENPLANNAGGANIETANQRYRREQAECCWSRVVFFLMIMVSTIMGAIVALILGVYDHLLKTYGIGALFIFMLYGVVPLGAICIIGILCRVIGELIANVIDPIRYPLD